VELYINVLTKGREIMAKFTKEEIAEGDRFMAYGAIAFIVVALVLMILGLIARNGILCAVGSVFLIIGAAIRYAK
jgi:hypothetical protein